MNQYGFSECFFYSHLVRYSVLVHATLAESVLTHLGAVDSVIYTTTRKLIKPINFPNHMQTLNSDNPSRKTSVILSRNLSSAKHADM